MGNPAPLSYAVEYWDADKGWVQSHAGVNTESTAIRLARGMAKTYKTQAIAREWMQDRTSTVYDCQWDNAAYRVKGART